MLSVSNMRRWLRARTLAVTRAAGDRNPVEAWNFRIIYVNAHAQYGS